MIFFGYWFPLHSFIVYYETAMVMSSCASSFFHHVQRRRRTIALLVYYAKRFKWPSGKDKFIVKQCKSSLSTVIFRFMRPTHSNKCRPPPINVKLDFPPIEKLLLLLYHKRLRPSSSLFSPFESFG